MKELSAAGDEAGTALVGALIVRDGMLLLGRRSSAKAACPDTWDVIGGHVEAGETFEDALLREVGRRLESGRLFTGESLFATRCPRAACSCCSKSSAGQAANHGYGITNMLN